jgi:hypothetical protein
LRLYLGVPGDKWAAVGMAGHCCPSGCVGAACGRPSADALLVPARMRPCSGLSRSFSVSGSGNPVATCCDASFTVVTWE